MVETAETTSLKTAVVIRVAGELIMKHKSTTTAQGGLKRFEFQFSCSTREEEEEESVLLGGTRQLYSTPADTIRYYTCWKE